ncbi:hypothetical protein GJAV_G00114360 [Gymnothorax javanicus]|nr:hypothetical protein GJAV_G00114360 [Gymnothorax javanicus]
MSARFRDRAFKPRVVERARNKASSLNRSDLPPNKIEDTGTIQKRLYPAQSVLSFPPLEVSRPRSTQRFLGVFNTGLYYTPCLETS